MKVCLMNYLFNCNHAIHESAEIIANALITTHTGLTSDGIATLIGTLFVGIVASTVAIYSFIYSEKSNRKKEIIDMLDKLITISIEYPKLENKFFIQQWEYLDDNDDSLRYDNYCCMVFNFIERLWKFAKKNEEIMNEIVYYKEYIDTHYRWWQKNYTMNQAGYPEGFPAFIENSKTEHNAQNSTEEN